MTLSKNQEWMLWQVDEKLREEPVTANLIRAIQYYSEKYGQIPNRCEVTAGWADELKMPRGMVVERTKTMQPYQFLLTLDSNLDNTDGEAKMIRRRKN